MEASKIFAAGIVALGFMAALVLGVLWGGYVFNVLWGWFIVTAFGAPPLTLAQAMGVSLSVRFLSPRHRQESKDGDQSLKDLFQALMTPLLFLAVGWLVKQWLPT